MFRNGLYMCHVGSLINKLPLPNAAGRFGHSSIAMVMPIATCR